MIRYTLYGSKGCVKCLVAKKLLEAMKIEYIYRDVESAEELANYHYIIDKCDGDGNKLPGLLMCEVGDNPELLKRLIQGDSVLDYLEAKRQFKEKKK